MKSAAQVRQQIETALENRVPGALTPPARPRPEQAQCGITDIDELLQGGLPKAALTELVGPECSGRTTIALAYVAAATQAGGICAWIDAADALDPESAAASGVDLERLLWVRCGSGPRKNNCIVPEALSTALPSTKADPSPSYPGDGSPHLRTEDRAMPQATSVLLQTHDGLYGNQERRGKKAIGTPGMPNRPLTGQSYKREEQVNSDRLPPRRGDNLSIPSRCAEPQPRKALSLIQNRPLPLSIFRAERMNPKNPSEALDQALQATDLLLQSGGFCVIVLDLASTSPEVAWRVPLATWFRFRTSCERARISLVLLTQHPCSRNSAELVVRLQTGTLEAESKVMTGIKYVAEIERSRSHEFESRTVSTRKPPQRAHEWKSEAAWTLTK